jgi:hypothetical protein
MMDIAEGVLKPPTLVDELLQEYVIPTTTFDIDLSKGHRLVFRTVPDPADFERLKAQAKASLKAFWADDGTEVPGPWAGFRPINGEVAIRCYLLYATCVRVEAHGESEEMPQAAWYQFAKSSYAAFNGVWELWSQFQSNRLVWDLLEKVQSEGEGSGETR